MVSEFEVTRRVLVDLEGISLRRKWLSGLEPENVHMMIGKLISSDCVNDQFLPSFHYFANFDVTHISMHLLCRLHDH